MCLNWCSTGCPSMWPLQKRKVITSKGAGVKLPRMKVWPETSHRKCLTLLSRNKQVIRICLHRKSRSTKSQWNTLKTTTESSKSCKGEIQSLTSQSRRMRVNPRRRKFWTVTSRRSPSAQSRLICSSSQTPIPPMQTKTCVIWTNTLFPSSRKFPSKQSQSRTGAANTFRLS